MECIEDTDVVVVDLLGGVEDVAIGRLEGELQGVYCESARSWLVDVLDRTSLDVVIPRLISADTYLGSTG